MANIKTFKAKFWKYLSQLSNWLLLKKTKITLVSVMSELKCDPRLHQGNKWKATPRDPWLISAFVTIKMLMGKMHFINLTAWYDQDHMTNNLNNLHFVQRRVITIITNCPKTQQAHIKTIILYILCQQKQVDVERDDNIYWSSTFFLIITTFVIEVVRKVFRAKSLKRLLNSFIKL